MFGCWWVRPPDFWRPIRPAVAGLVLGGIMVWIAPHAWLGRVGAAWVALSGGVLAVWALCQASFWW